MPDIAHSATDMISGMSPEPQTGDFVFVTTTDASQIAALAPAAVATFKEHEGLSLIVPVQAAQDLNLATDSPMRCITLNVYSSLEAVGLTAAVASALGAASIPCNMVAAYHHDRVFVPSQTCDQAMAVLTDLQKQAT